MIALTKRKGPKALFTPQAKEMVKAVKQAACTIYDLSEEDLLNDKSYTVASVRFMCFSVLFNNAGLKDYAIADAFGKSRNAVCNGLSKIEGQRDVYRDVREAINTIITTANEYPSKKFHWCIQ